MKRITLFVLVILFASIAWCQTPGDADALQQQLNQHIAQRADINKRVDLSDAKEADIKFVIGTYQKALAKHNEEYDAYQAKYTEVQRGYELLAPAAENYSQRVDAHNAHQCVEKCTGNSCDGSCAWYEQEKAQLDSNKAQLQAAYAPLDAQGRDLKQTYDYLSTTASQLAEIKSKALADIEAWKTTATALKAEWDANEEAIQRLEGELAKLKGENDACFSKIPPACQVNPLLDDKCEQMHAACGKLFDGNK
jgi:chromosome segregation ATPase